MEGINTANVSIEINQKPKNYVEIPKEQIKIINSIAKYDYKITTGTVILKLEGINKDYDEINPNDLEVYIDVENYKEGEYSIPLDVKVPDDLRLIDNYYVGVKISR